MNTYDLKYLSFEQEPASLWPEDIALFEKMERDYVSEEEKLFFKKMKLKMEYECAPCGDDIMLGDSNGDKLYITRRDPCEFVISRYVDVPINGNVQGTNQVHTTQKLVCYYANNLSDALDHNLKDLVGRDITLFEWLRERNYEGIEYNGNSAYN